MKEKPYSKKDLFTSIANEAYTIPLIDEKGKKKEFNGIDSMTRKGFDTDYREIWEIRGIDKKGKKLEGIFHLISE